MILRWGIIGCGAVANSKGGPSLYNVKRSKLVAVMSRREEKARAFARRHGAKKFYTKVEDLLKDEEIDAVYIATPPYVHCQYTIRAAEAGKHVLCEKPMAMTVKECRMMIDACRRADVKLMVAYYRRGWPNVQAVKKVIDQGEIGDIILAKVHAARYYGPEKISWRINPEISGGGVLMDLGSHYIDLLTYLLGDVSGVKALTESVYWNYEVEDSAMLLMKFERGSHGVASFNWNIGVRELEFGIYGTKGKVSFSPGSPSRSGDFTLFLGEEEKKINLKPTSITHLEIVRNFISGVLEDEELICPGEEGIKTNKVIEAAYKSSRRMDTDSL